MSLIEGEGDQLVNDYLNLDRILMKGGEHEEVYDTYQCEHRH